MYKESSDIKILHAKIQLIKKPKLSPVPTKARGDE
jgi:hypothetical protein